MSQSRDISKGSSSCVPRIIPGPASLFNKGSISWGHQGLVAYGSNSYVVIIEPHSVHYLHVLKGHKSFVKKIAWTPYSILEKTDDDFLSLASGDESGQIIFWNVKLGKPITYLQDSVKTILSLDWLRTGGKQKDLLLVSLHAQYYFILWDVTKKIKLWKKNFTDVLLSMTIDPFDSSRIAFLSTDSIVFLNDFTYKRSPSSNGSKLYVSSPKSVDRSCAENASRTRERLKSLMKTLVVSHLKPKSDAGLTISESIEIQFHRSLRHHLLVLYPRDILILDLEMETAVGIVSLEQSTSPFTQVISCRQRDALYCLHESGSISVRIKTKVDLGVSLASPLDAPFQNPDSGFMWYETLIQSDVIRLMKGSKVLGISVCPISECRIVLLMTSGKVVVYELERIPFDSEKKFNKLSFILQPSLKERNPSLRVRLLVQGVLFSLLHPLNVMKVAPSPPDGTDPVLPYPLVAVGSQCGMVQLCSASQGMVIKELSLHNYPVRGIEWCSHRSFISWAYQSADMLVQNEVFITDIYTGESLPFRAEGNVEPPIEMIKASPLRQYFILVLKDRPVELWDLQKLCVLRTMSRKFPYITALEWSPIFKKKRKKSSGDKIPILEESNEEGSSKEREFFVMCDTESCLYHFIVENHSIVEGVKIPSEVGLGTVTCIAWKNNKILQADTEGLINIWDLKARCSNGTHANRGPVLKMCLAPGKTNFKLFVLFNDGVQSADVIGQVYNKHHQAKSPDDFPKIIDIDWADGDSPILITKDSYCHILKDDLTNTVVSLSDLRSPSFSYHLHEINKDTKSEHYLQFLLYRIFDSPKISNKNNLYSVRKYMGLSDYDYRFFSTTEIMQCIGYIYRCSTEIDFWTIANYYMKAAQIVNKLPNDLGPPLSASNFNWCQKILSLDTCYDFICDNYSFKQLQLERLQMQEWRRTDYDHSRLVIQRLILLDQKDKAVQFLLETDFDHPNYYTDAIKACLIATIQAGDVSQSTIKLVATNLIANGKIWEGVQLLCLIGKGSDACRYLLSYNFHTSVIWLAKAVLPVEECKEIMSKIADYYHAKGDKDMYFLILLSLYEFNAVLQILIDEGQWEKAFAFFVALEEHELPVKDELVASVISSICCRKDKLWSSFDEDILSEVDRLICCRLNLDEVGWEEFKANNAPSKQVVSV